MSSKSVKSFGEICEGEFEVLQLTEEDLEGAINVLCESFFKYENCCIATEIDRPESEVAREDLIELVRKVSTMGVSLIAKHTSTGEVVSVAINKIILSTNSKDIAEFSQIKCRAPNSKAFIDFMCQVESSYDFFKMLKIDCHMEIMFLSTLPKFSGRKLAKTLCQYSVNFGKELKEGKGLENICEKFRDKRIGAVTAMMTAKQSQKIAISLGMNTVLEVPFEKCSFDGKTFAERIGPLVPTLKLVVIKI